MALLSALIVILAASSQFYRVQGNTTPETRTATGNTSAAEPAQPRPECPHLCPAPLFTCNALCDDATEPGNGILTNLHVTDLDIEGPVPNQTCMFGQLRELDLDGGAMTGTIPFFLTQCFPYVNEIDLSYNQLTGTLPAFMSTITSLVEMELESNLLTGTIPTELSIMPNITSLRFENNLFTGSIPPSFSNLTDTLFILLLYNNDFEGDLSMMSGANLGEVSTADNPKLCGMVPASVRWAHGYNPHNTSLGLPCA